MECLIMHQHLFIRLLEHWTQGRPYIWHVKFMPLNWIFLFDAISFRGQSMSHPIFHDNLPPHKWESKRRSCGIINTKIKKKTSHLRYIIIILKIVVLSLWSLCLERFRGGFTNRERERDPKLMCYLFLVYWLTVVYFLLLKLLFLISIVINIIYALSVNIIITYFGQT